jgi:hypothetical protein
MMESDFRRCRSCGDQLEEDSEDICPDCVSERRRMDLLSFRFDLSQLVGKFPTADLLVDRCPTVRSRLQDWTVLSSRLLTDLDDYLGPSDSCIPWSKRT